MERAMPSSGRNAWYTASPDFSFSTRFPGIVMESPLTLLSYTYVPAGASSTAAGLSASPITAPKGTKSASAMRGITADFFMDSSCLPPEKADEMNQPSVHAIIIYIIAGITK